MKIEYLDFSYIKLNPKNLVGSDEFNQTFFDKIDQIEVDISNEIDFETIISNLDIEPIKISNFRYSKEKNEIEKRIFELRNNKIDLFESNNDFIVYNINSIEQREPNINDNKIKDEIINLILERNKI